MPGSDGKLRPHWYFVLLALCGQDAHGFAIARDVLEQTDGRVRLWPAMLYGTLEQLLDREWIRELNDEERPAGASAKERYYRLTPAGRAAVEREAERLSAIARLARQRLRRRGPRTA